MLIVSWPRGLHDSVFVWVVDDCYLFALSTYFHLRLQHYLSLRSSDDALMLYESRHTHIDHSSNFILSSRLELTSLRAWSCRKH
jgi:hypothetical protein